MYNMPDDFGFKAGDYEHIYFEFDEPTQCARCHESYEQTFMIGQLCYLCALYSKEETTE